MNGSNIVFGSVVNMALAATPSAGTYLVAYDNATKKLSQKDDQGVVTLIGVLPTPSGTLDRFSSDIAVSLSPGKSFGKYVSGDIVPAINKTGVEVIIDALTEPIAPTISLNSSTTIKYNQRDISNTLDFSYEIKSLGANVSSTLLEYRRNNSGSWATLSTSPSTPSSFEHILTDTIGFNRQPFNYRYTVTDSQGGTNSVTKDITPEQYVTPNITLQVIAATKSGPETDLKREKGNIKSNLTGTISKRSQFVDLVSYQFQYKKNNSGSWQPIGGTFSITSENFTIPITLHDVDNQNAAANSIVYSIKVIDTNYNTGGAIESIPVTINFLNIIFYGPANAIPSSSNEVRALPYRDFTDVSNPFILNTGIVDINYIVAIPSTISISSAADLDSSNAPIYYTATELPIFDFISTSVTYKIYSASQRIPYSNNHRHNIFR